MLGRAGKDVGQGLWKRVVSDPQNPRLHRRVKAVVISSNTTVNFVYNVLWFTRCSSCATLSDCILPFKTKPIDLD